MTYPKCNYCDGVALPADPPGEAIRFIGGICATCVDVEFCCNVSKDLYGTKRLAHVVAEERGMTHVLARFAEKQAALEGSDPAAYMAARADQLIEELADALTPRGCNCRETNVRQS